MYLFMDEDPFARRRERHFTEGPVTMCLIGSLPVWDAAVQ
eukprot:CAMPEP_0179340860 /NCGR_PEP_ID=MMETSP0797-20121207/69511_1 /TAXON_ID=47934 /ORGANISM="Dinophysis acuminata, Strain DAEP01" /LENGTH=39 /DNA_ID= /DNA_START= /DNA_END= /DNA_ORIENTATION=